MLPSKENGLQDGILQAVAHMYAVIKIDLALDDETIYLEVGRVSYPLP